MSLSAPARSHLACHGETEHLSRLLLQAGLSTLVPKGLARLIPGHRWTKQVHGSCGAAQGHQHKTTVILWAAAQPLSSPTCNEPPAYRFAQVLFNSRKSLAVPPVCRRPSDGVSNDGSESCLDLLALSLEQADI